MKKTKNNFKYDILYLVKVVISTALVVFGVRSNNMSLAIAGVLLANIGYIFR